MTSSAQNRRITLNGGAVDTVATTIAELLSTLDIATKRVGVERNREIVPRSAYAQTAVETGDRIEIVQFVGGG